MKKILSLILVVVFMFLLTSSVFAYSIKDVDNFYNIEKQISDIVNMNEEEIYEFVSFTEKKIKENQGFRMSKYYYPDKYYQNGEFWSSDYMGNTKYTIGGSGCALTSFAMLISLYGIDENPRQVNNTMGNYACLFGWDVAQVRYDLPQYHFSDSDLNDDVAKSAVAGILEEEGVCVVGMKKNLTTHFVLARGYYMTSNNNIGIRIYDPNRSNDYIYLRDYLNRGWSVKYLIYYSN